MKTGLKLIARKMRSNISQLVGLVFLLVVGVSFFITLFTIALRYDDTSERYYSDYAYADVTFYGTFDDESVRLLSSLDGVRSAAGRTVRDFRAFEQIVRVISLTDGINIPYLYEGRCPEDKTECILLKRNADALNLSIGDDITAGDQTLKITGLAASVEYIYLVQNERIRMAQPEKLGVVYVTEEFFTDPWCEIVAMVDDGFSVDNAQSQIAADMAVLKKDQINHALCRSDIKEIRTFSYIFPSIFAVLIAVVIYVMLSRTIQKDRKQIGTLKALGASDRKIIGIYLSQFCFSACIGALLGCVLAVFVTGTIIDIFSSLFVVPTLSFVVYPELWLSAVFISIALCAVSGLIATARILPLLPAHAMRPRPPKGGRRTLLERVGFVWKRLSFNTRYSLKNSLRNKARFFAVVLGMCGSCSLLAFSQGFNDSIQNTQDKYFSSFAKYDVIITFDMLPLDMAHPAAEKTDENYKAFLLPVKIRGENHTLAVVENGFDMVDIPSGALQDGLIIPEHYANQWRVGVGDTLAIDGHAAVISAVAAQYIGLTFYTSFDYIRTVTDEIPLVYNTIYARNTDMAALTANLYENDIDFTTVDDDKATFDSLMDSFSVLVWFMIASSIMLGFIVLYSIGLINLSSREYEYMFMGVMGYPHKSILFAHIKETVLQLVLSISLGLMLGRLILESVKGEFSSATFVLSSAIHPQSYLVSALSVIGITALMTVVTSRYVGRLDIVEGLKEQDE